MTFEEFKELQSLVGESQYCQDLYKTFGYDPIEEFLSDNREVDEEGEPEIDCDLEDELEFRLAV